MIRAPFFGGGYFIREPITKKRVKGTTGLLRSSGYSTPKKLRRMVWGLGFRA